MAGKSHCFELIGITCGFIGSLVDLVSTSISAVHYVTETVCSFANSGYMVYSITDKNDDIEQLKMMIFIQKKMQTMFIDDNYGSVLGCMQDGN